MSALSLCRGWVQLDLTHKEFGAMGESAVETVAPPSSLHTHTLIDKHPVAQLGPCQHNTSALRHTMVWVDRLTTVSRSPPPPPLASPSPPTPPPLRLPGCPLQEARHDPLWSAARELRPHRGGEDAPQVAGVECSGQRRQRQRRAGTGRSSRGAQLPGRRWRWRWKGGQLEGCGGQPGR